MSSFVVLGLFFNRVFIPELWGLDGRLVCDGSMLIYEQIE